MDDRYTEARALFEHEKYMDAAEAFDVLEYSFSGSALMDSIKYFAGTSRYELKEFILAANDFEYITQHLPNSPLLDLAQYKLGECYFKAAPRYSLDQTYTFKAIEALQFFLTEFPDSQYKDQVEQLLLKSRTKLAKKDFENGRIYFKMQRYKACILYMDYVLQNYYDIPEVAGEALYYKSESLLELDRKQDALALFRSYVAQYPQGENASRAHLRIRELQ